MYYIQTTQPIIFNFFILINKEVLNVRNSEFPKKLKYIILMQLITFNPQFLLYFPDVENF